MLRYIKILLGIFYDFPPPDEQLKYHRWTKKQGAIAWLGIGFLFMVAMYSLGVWP